MAVAPSPGTKVYLCDTPLNQNQKHQITFSNTAEQQAYFLNRKILTLSDYTYQRKDSVIRANCHIDDIIMANYCFYENVNHAGKWYYAFITKMEYVNENTTYIYIKTDVYQTWLFDYTFKPSFVLREHVSDDSIGANLIDEGLETGEYTFKSMDFSGCLQLFRIIVGSTVDASLSPNMGGYYAGVYNGFRYYYFTDPISVDGFLETLANAGKEDAIVSIFMFPADFLDEHDDGDTIYGGGLKYNSKSVSKNTSSLDGYYPKNNKLYTYPFNLLYVSNNNGNKAEYRYEFFSSSNCSFLLAASLTPNSTIYCIPQNYKGVSMNYEEMLTLAGLPMCGWNYDVFKNWLAQNGVSIALGIAQSGVQAGLGVAKAVMTEGLMGTDQAISGAFGVANQLANVYQHSIQPPQARGNTAGGGSALGLGTFDFTFIKATIKAQFAEMIDNFFEMFGYKVNSVKIPNMTNRPYWNYVQTVDAQIKGYMPQNDIVELQDIFNKGVTLWHDTNYILDYSRNNH